MAMTLSKSYYNATEVWPQNMRCFKIKNLCFGWENKKGALLTHTQKLKYGE
jgi:hypothetical protein